jgi:hypothetical protein
MPLVSGMTLAMLMHWSSWIRRRCVYDSLYARDCNVCGHKGACQGQSCTTVLPCATRLCSSDPSLRAGNTV